MTAPSHTFTFCWWNLHNFAHYDVAKSSKKRWPKSRQDYEAKKQRFHLILKELYPAGLPDLLAVCEVTREVASDLQRELPSGFCAAVAPEYSHDDGFQVAIFYKPNSGLSAELPIVPGERGRASIRTRPMIPIHLTIPGHVIRFVACHWTAFESEDSDLARERSADVLGEDTYKFLNPNTPQSGFTRHAVILGDFNQEPTAALFRKRLPARRDHDSTRIQHYTDEAVMRVRFYNLAWRFLGEQVPHGSTMPTLGGAGTVFEPPHNWKTFDQILVSSSLLSPTAPFIDESNTRVACTPLMLGEDRRPRPFIPHTSSGMSDHLPLLGQLTLRENPQ